LARETLAIKRRVLGPSHPSTALSEYNLASMLARKGDHDEALSVLRAAVNHGLRADVALAIEKDADFNSLHGDPRFAAVVALTKVHAADRKTK
jgi:hypothetical protein